MTKPHSDWRLLPAEIYHCIIQRVTTKELYNCAEDFNVLERRTSSILTALFSTLLPNLEVIGGNGLDIYVPLRRALTDSDMKCLRRIDPPDQFDEEGEMVFYTYCAWKLMKRLEKFLLSDESLLLGRSDGEALTFNSLYSQLTYFDKLVEIQIHKDTNEGVRLLEDIIESCPSLKSVDFLFRSSDYETLPNNSNVTMDEIVNFTPRPNIKTLTGELEDATDDKILLYIMRKFSCLDKLDINVNDDDGFRHVSHQVLDQLLPYVSNIKDASVFGFKSNHESMVMLMDKYWKALSGRGRGEVHILYSDLLPPESISFKTKSTFLRYSSATRKHVDLIQRVGKFIGKVRFQFLIFKDDSSFKTALADDYLTHMFTNCPHLKTLWLVDCALKASTRSTEKYTLDELGFERCEIYPEVLESWSMDISQIEHLLFISTNYTDEYDDCFELFSMPHTKVNLITVGADFSTRYVKVFNTVDKVCHYYSVRYGNIYSVTATEEEYLYADEDDRIEIRCASSPAVMCRLAVD
ncbi:unnamed protein product [Mucor hiemalis]